MTQDDDSHLVESRLASETVFSGRLLVVRRDNVRLPNGGEATREFVVHPGAVLIVPVLDDGRLVLERQFRYPVGRVMLEFPAGKIDPGEAPLATAQREQSITIHREEGFVFLVLPALLALSETTIMATRARLGLPVVGPEVSDWCRQLPYKARQARGYARLLQLLMLGPAAHDAEAARAAGAQWQAAIPACTW